MAQLEWFGDEIAEEIEKAVLAGIADALLNVYVSRLNIIIGQTYSPPPSAPGEPPHSMRGRGDPESLINSIMIWAVPERSCVIVGSMADFAVHLEFGTQSMEARPVWQPVLIDVLDIMEERLARKARDFLETNAPRLSSNKNLNIFSVMTSDIPSQVPMAKATLLPSIR